MRNALLYSSTVSEVLSTEDGNDLDSDCARAYSDASVTKTNEMKTRITGAMTEWTECAGKVELITASGTFVVLGDQVILIPQLNDNQACVLFSMRLYSLSYLVIQTVLFVYDNNV